MLNRNTLLNDYQQLNINNYSHDAVDVLINWANQAYDRLSDEQAQAVEAQQVAVPMTNDQIEAACRFIEPSLDGPIAYDLLIARAIEKHHGIGAK